MSETGSWRFAVAFEPTGRLGAARTVVDGETLTLVESWFTEFEDQATGGGHKR